jgi:predicted glycosyltransferase involved in capsule biosynthesis
MDMLYTFQFETDHIQKAFNRLVCSINSLQNQNLNIIVLNGSYKDIIKDLKLNVNRELAYVHKYNYKKGSKGKLINHGAKHFVKSDFFFISDIDLIYPPNFIEEFNNLDLYENDIPKRIVFDSYFLRKELYNFNHRLLLRELKEHNTHTPAPGNGLIHRNSFLYLRGFNEDMLGWGFEDTVFNLRIGKINIYREYDHIRTVHLWHERTNSIQEQKNNQMFLNYKNIFMTDDEKYKKYLIANNKDKWGEY